MSRFFVERYAALTPYTPGEQPQERKYLKLNTNESPFPPSPRAQEQMRATAAELQLYSDPDCRALRKLAAAQWGLSEEELMFVNGSDEVLDFAFMAFCDASHPALFPDVTYGFYQVFAEKNGVPYETRPLNEDFRVNLSDYLHTGKTIFLANPNAQTGVALSRSEVEQIVASNPDSVVVIDEAYVDFGAESVLPLIHRYDNLLVTQTFSKSRSLAGARLGFGAGCPALIADLNTLRYATNPYNVSRMAMAAGAGSLADTDYFTDNCRSIRENRDWTAEKLRQLGFSLTDSRANFLLARHEKVGGQALYLALKEAGVLVRHFETPRLRDYNRITIGSRQQMKDFIRIVGGILEDMA